MKLRWDAFNDFSSRDWRLLLAIKLWLRARYQPGLSDKQRSDMLRHGRGLEVIHKRLEARGELPKGPPPACNSQ